MSTDGFRYEENPRTFSEVRVLMNEHGSGFVIEIDYESRQPVSTGSKGSSLVPAVTTSRSLWTWA